MIKRRRGAALPGAIILCSLIVIISLGLSTVFLSITATNQLARAQNNNSLTYSQAFNNFKETGNVPDDSKYTWTIYETEIDGDVYKALCAKNSNDQVVFYGIYNFTHDKVVAYQESNFYITNEGGTDYLAGIVPMVEAE